MTELTLEAVELRYGNHSALRNISLSLKGNTICGLLGRNGSGKTSLMSLIASYRRATKGRILYNGEPLFDSPHAMPDIAFVYHTSDDRESPRIEKLFERAARVRPTWSDDLARQLLGDVNLSPRRYLWDLSQGETAIVRGIMGLASQCPITLYDEAYQGMDAAMRTWFIQKILEDYLENPRIIMFSTHFIQEVEHILEEVIVLDKGKLLYHENVDSLRSKGVSITGDKMIVDKLIATHDFLPLSSRTLGSQKEIILFEDIPLDVKEQAHKEGLELNHPNLQDLFVHITK